MNNNKTIGDTLREIRESLNFKTADLAEEVDVSPSYVYQVESNIQMPSTEYLDALIKIYISRSGEETEEKVKRVELLISMSKDQYIEKNQSKIQRKAERRYGVLYDLVSQN